MIKPISQHQWNEVSVSLTLCELDGSAAQFARDLGLPLQVIEDEELGPLTGVLFDAKGIYFWVYQDESSDSSLLVHVRSFEPNTQTALDTFLQTLEQGSQGNYPITWSLPNLGPARWCLYKKDHPSLNSTPSFENELYRFHYRDDAVRLKQQLEQKEASQTLVFDIREVLH